MDEDKLVGKLVEAMKEHFPTKREFNARFDENDEAHAELLASAKTLDKVLEKHPVERIERIEKHLNLPEYAHSVEEE